ncbi:hypothetical protein [Janthinobacterium sp.]|uniref:hypothetical protein n=1 Tax=Janthinobacterium sp. TaxID=1871054 RepID=UPI00293D1DD5|nr:hypothetical protein [Janthinobacterium sp.]
MDASFFPPQALAAPHAHYRSHGLFCATKDRMPFGTGYTLSSRSGHIYGRVVKLDICGRHRIDLPEGTFRDFFGKAGVRQGVVPVIVRIDKPYIAAYRGKRKHAVSKHANCKANCKHLRRSHFNQTTKG